MAQKTFGAYYIEFSFQAWSLFCMKYNIIFFKKTQKLFGETFLPFHWYHLAKFL